MPNYVRSLSLWRHTVFKNVNKNFVFTRFADWTFCISLFCRFYSPTLRKYVNTKSPFTYTILNYASHSETLRIRNWEFPRNYIIIRNTQLRTQLISADYVNTKCPFPYVISHCASLSLDMKVFCFSVRIQNLAELKQAPSPNSLCGRSFQERPHYESINGKQSKASGVHLLILFFLCFFA